MKKISSVGRALVNLGLPKLDGIDMDCDKVGQT